MNKWIVLFLVLVFVVVLFWKFGSKVQAPTKQSPPPKEQIVEGLPPLTEKEFEDKKEKLKQLKEVKSYADAITVAKGQKKQVFLYFGATWCGPCKHMKETTLKDANVKNALTAYVVWMVDTDNDRATATKYGVSGIPAYMVVDPNTEKAVRQPSHSGGSGQGSSSSSSVILDNASSSHAS
jgi:thiol:disulfide interchange protein